MSTGDVSRQLLGEGAGQIAHHNEVVTVDVLLQNNAITLPVTKWDGNNRYFPVQRDGSISGTGGDLFSRTFGTNQGGMLLDVVTNGVANRFVGATIGTVEEGGREVVTRQQGIGGLNVTRKAYISRTGYFGRYLEVLTNPTAAPITVDVRVSSILPRYAGGDFYTLLTTSSGDNVASVADAAAPDRWVVFDDTDTTGGDATAFVFDGPNAVQRAGALSVQNNPDPACQFISFSGCYAQKLLYEWQSVTIQPGASVAYVHFLSQQRQRARGLASAQRLALLPPEALVGLSAFEIGIIRNFAVPADGNSAVPPLPSVTGTISGTVFEGDGVTPVRSTVQGVRFNTLSALYDVEQRVNTDAQGRFTIAASLNDNGNTLLVPVEPFTLVGRHPLTNLSSPTVSGSFAQGSTTATQNVVFSSSVLLKGFVRRHTGVVVPNASITAQGTGFFAQVFQIGSDGSYAIGGLPSGTPLTITATLSHPQGFSLQSVTLLQGAAGEVIVRDLAFPPTGSLTGVVRTATNAVAPNVSVRIWQLDQFGNPIASRGTTTDTSGAFVFPDVPVSTYRLEATDPVSTVITRVNVTIVQDQTIAQDLQLVGSGSVQVDVTYLGGAPAAQTSVIVRDVAGNQRFLQTNASGRATIVNVPVGAFTAEAQHPKLFSAKATAGGTMPSHGALVPIALTLPAVGSVQVQVNYAGGTPAAGASVQMSVAGSPFFQSFGNTDSSGRLTIDNVLGGVESVRVFHPQAPGAFSEASATLSAEGQVLPITVVLPATGSLQVLVTSVGGDPVSGSQILVKDAFDSFQRFGGTTDANGRVTVTQVRGAFDVQANDPTDSRFNRHTGGVIVSEGQSIPITIVLALAAPSPEQRSTNSGSRWPRQPST